MALWFSKKRCLRLIKSRWNPGRLSNSSKDPLVKSVERFWNMRLSRLPSMRLGFQCVPLQQSVRPSLPGGMSLRTASSSCLPWGNKAASPWEASAGGSEEICLQRRDGKRPWKCELLLPSAHRFPFAVNLWHWNSLLIRSGSVCHLPWACWSRASQS